MLSPLSGPVGGAFGEQCFFRWIDSLDAALFRPFLVVPLLAFVFLDCALGSRARFGLSANSVCGLGVDRVLALLSTVLGPLVLLFWFNSVPCCLLCAGSLLFQILILRFSRGSC